MTEPQMTCTICKRLLSAPLIGLDRDTYNPNLYRVVHVIDVHPPGGMSSKTADLWCHRDCLVRAGRKVSLNA